MKALIVIVVIIFITLFGCEYVIDPDVTLEVPDGSLSVELPDLSTFLEDDCDCPVCDAGTSMDAGMDGGNE